MSRRLSPAKSAAQARRKLYFEARGEGLDKWDAGTAAGLEDAATIRRYERWYQAFKAGEVFLSRVRKKDDG